jgi:hypothetical protein
MASHIPSRIVRDQVKPNASSLARWSSLSLSLLRRCVVTQFPRMGSAAYFAGTRHVPCRSLYSSNNWKLSSQVLLFCFFACVAFSTSSSLMKLCPVANNFVQLPGKSGAFCGRYNQRRAGLVDFILVVLVVLIVSLGSITRDSDNCNELLITKSKRKKKKPLIVDVHSILVTTILHCRPSWLLFLPESRVDA